MEKTLWSRSKNRTKSAWEVSLVRAFGCPLDPYLTLGAYSSLPASRDFCLPWRIALPKYATRLFAKCWSLEYLQESCNSARLLPSSGLFRMPDYELPDSWSPQRFPTKKMITIVPHSCVQVVKFIFAGRNSGQQERKARSVRHSNVRRPRTDSLCHRDVGWQAVNCCAWGRERPRPRRRPVCRSAPRIGSYQRNRP